MNDAELITLCAAALIIMMFAVALITSVENSVVKDCTQHSRMRMAQLEVYDAETMAVREMLGMFECGLEGEHVDRSRTVSDAHLIWELEQRDISGMEAKRMVAELRAMYGEAHE